MRNPLVSSDLYIFDILKVIRFIVVGENGVQEDRCPIVFLHQTLRREVDRPVPCEPILGLDLDNLRRIGAAARASDSRDWSSRSQG